MAIQSRGRQCRERGGEIVVSPERTMVWTEPRPRRVPVVYYLSRNGLLEHPHFMEVPLSSPHGLFLRDVINRLNSLRGRGMASLYSWSSKRGYKNGFVWHDLSEDDVVYPAHGHECILKGSELLNVGAPSPARSRDSDLSCSSTSSELAPLAVPRNKKKKNQWEEEDEEADAGGGEYKVFRSEMIADAATQTEEKKGRAARVREAEVERDEVEISPPPRSASSTEEAEAAEKGRARLTAEEGPVGGYQSGRFRASAVLMQIMSCGSITVKDQERLTRGGPDSGRREMDGGIGVSMMRFEDKEYFSGSLVETEKRGDAGPVLKRSNSDSADRKCKAEDLREEEEEVEAGRAKCIPRRARVTSDAAVCRSAHGSKRVDELSSGFKLN